MTSLVTAGQRAGVVAAAAGIGFASATAAKATRISGSMTESERRNDQEFKVQCSSIRGKTTRYTHHIAHLLPVHPRLTWAAKPAYRKRLAITSQRRLGTSEIELALTFLLA